LNAHSAFFLFADDNRIGKRVSIESTRVLLWDTVDYVEASRKFRKGTETQDAYNLIYNQFFVIFTLRQLTAKQNFI